MCCKANSGWPRTHWGRVLINTSMGMGGMFDFRHPVRHSLSPQRSRDHARDPGASTKAPYLVLPVLGPVQSARPWSGRSETGSPIPAIKSPRPITAYGRAWRAGPRLRHRRALRATSRASPTSNAPRSTIMRQFARFTVSAARRRSGTKKRTCPTPAPVQSSLGDFARRCPTRLLPAPRLHQVLDEMTRTAFR